MIELFSKTDRLLEISYFHQKKLHQRCLDVKAFFYYEASAAALAKKVKKVKKLLPPQNYFFALEWPFMCNELIF